MFAFLRNEETSSSPDYVIGGLSSGNQDGLEDCTLCCETDVKPLISPLHVICMILNIVLPGTGTIISSFTCLHYKTIEDKARKELETTPTPICLWGTMCDGVMQLVLTFFIFGWIWSIIVGCNLYNKSKEAYEKDKQL